MRSRLPSRAAVDTKHQLIIAHEVTTQRNDHTSLQAMASQAQQTLGSATMTVVADTGYRNGEQAQACEAKGITPMVPMQQPSQTQVAGAYPKTLFAYDAARDTYRCPAGEVLKRYRRERRAKIDYYCSSACSAWPAQSAVHEEHSAHHRAALVR